jgi:hypothetical protein
MATTTNFGWATPDDTDLVKDGAAAIRTLGSSIDTSLVDLKGGTTGQVLAKASNSDLDFNFVTPAGSPLTTKGDLYTYSTADARLAVGANGTILTADSAETTGLKWATPSGSLTLISNTALSGSSVTISAIPQTYKNLYLLIKDYTNTSAGTVIFMRYNGDTATNYEYQAYVARNNASWTDTKIILMSNNVKETGGKNLIWHNIPDYSNSTTYKIGNGVGVAQSNDNVNQFQYEPLTSIYKDTTAITSLTILPNTGSMNGGNAFLYGVN